MDWMFTGAVHCCKRETKVCRVLFKRVGTSKGRAAPFLKRFQICCISSTWSRYRSSSSLCAFHRSFRVPVTV